MVDDGTGLDLWTSRVDGAELLFRLADPDAEMTAVRLWQDLGIPGDQLDLTAVDGGWELRLTRPSTHRVEYRFEVTAADGTSSEVLDPTNPQVVGSAFGERSWLALPGYVPPAWVDVRSVDSTSTELVVAGTPVGDVELRVWSPADAEPSEPLPLLLSHDGPEFASFAGLPHYVGAGVATGALPRMRLVLLRPGNRNPWYAANPEHTAALVDHVLPAIRFAVASRSAVLMGASLGALAALHAEWTRPATFAGLLLQSGSFFRPATDPQESGYAYYEPVTAFVEQVLGTDTAPSRPVVTMTCGAVEENVHNNRVMAAHLAAAGIPVELVETPDVHSFTAWRDMLDPHLTRLLQRVWGHDRAA